ncbi:MAG: gluconate 2-dehydrogenase subunit 3 family protein [Gemmatimonadaceae bacterium]|nr:gluconate 2-dehydrogenase subunit 3 family protein [Gemmatimonadaceae bacterium]
MNQDDRSQAVPDTAEAGAPDDALRHDAPTGLSRREALGLMAALPLVGAIELTPPVLQRALRAADEARTAREAGDAGAAVPKFFTAHEWRTVRMLVDYVVPRDDRSGSATDAGVPEFMDFIMGDKPNNQVWMRGGLAWLDLECGQRYGTTFVASKPAQRTEILDAIAYPAKATQAVRAGVAFFNRFRDMTASGFYSSKMGIADVQYMGNQMRPGWDGCPDAALAKLGVSYKDVY